MAINVIYCDDEFDLFQKLVHPGEERLGIAWPNVDQDMENQCAAMFQTVANIILQTGCAVAGNTVYIIRRRAYPNAPRWTLEMNFFVIHS